MKYGNEARVKVVYKLCMLINDIKYLVWWQWERQNIMEGDRREEGRGRGREEGSRGEENECKCGQEPISGAKERPTAENSDVLNGNFDLSVIDHIQQLETPHNSYTYRSCTLM